MSQPSAIEQPVRGRVGRRRIGRVLGLAAGTVLGLGMLASLGGWWTLRSSLPRTSGTVRVSGLAARATITRDAHGVPTVHGASEDDAVFALGYVHAQDRFFQLEFLRRFAAGRLAERFGEAALDEDRYMRPYGLDRAAAAAERAIAPRSLALLQRYAAGVNAWLAAQGRAPTPELALLRWRGYDAPVARWTPHDSLLLAKLFAIGMSRNAELEGLRDDLADRLPPARRADVLARLFPAYPPDGPTIVQPDATHPAMPAPAPAPRAPDATGPVAMSARRSSDVLARLFGPAGAGLGSNAWALSPSRTASGHAVVGNDPHVRMQFPSMFYLAALDAPGLHTIGATLPGLPAVVVGRNERIAWGISVLPADTEDLFVEHVDPHDPTRYLVEDGRSVPFDVRDEPLGVARRAPEPFRVRTTRHGPVVFDDAQRPSALRAVALDPDDTTLDAYFALQHASDWTSFRAALAGFVSPALNFVYADADGHIGYVAAGRVPRRDPRIGMNAADGREVAVPWPGGYVPYDAMPSVLDPAEGFIVTANDRVADGWPCGDLAVEWAAPYRATRLRALLGGRTGMTARDLEAVQSDVDDAVARALLPTLQSVPPRDERERAALSLLRSWNARADGDSAAAALFVAWRAAFTRELVRDVVPAVQIEHLLRVLNGQVLVDAVTDPRGVLCDDETTPAHERCVDTARASLGPALDRLESALGRDPRGWRLDALQGIPLATAIFEEIPVLGRLFVHRVGVGGDAETARVAELLRSDVRLASAFFALIDASPGVPPRFALLGGESGHPLSEHQRDQVDAWTHTAPFEIGVRDAAPSATLVLEPAR